MRAFDSRTANISQALTLTRSSSSDQSWRFEKFKLYVNIHFFDGTALAPGSLSTFSRRSLGPPEVQPKIADTALETHLMTGRNEISHQSHQSVIDLCHQNSTFQPAPRQNQSSSKRPALPAFLQNRFASYHLERPAHAEYPRSDCYITISKSGRDHGFCAERGTGGHLRHGP